MQSKMFYKKQYGIQIKNKTFYFVLKKNYFIEVCTSYFGKFERSALNNI